MNRWIKRISVVAGCVLAAGLWMEQHDARVRRQAELEQVRQQTAAQVAALKNQAAEEVKQANVENAKTIGKLEERRRRIEQQNRQLAAQLEALRKQAQIQAEEVATLPIQDVATRVAAQLGLQAQDSAAKERAVSRKGAEAQRKLRVTNYELPDVAVGDAGGTADIAQRAAVARDVGKGKAASRKGAEAQSFATVQNTGLTMTASGVRKVAAALVELNACRSESKIQSRLISNCRARSEADDAAIQSQAGSIASLNQALKAKDKILDQQAREYKAELSAARGSFWGRVARVSEHVAIGIALGVAIGAAAR